MEALPPGEEKILYAEIDLSTIYFSQQTIEFLDPTPGRDLSRLFVNVEAVKQVTM